MVRASGPAPIDDIAYLARSQHRVEALVAMTERPRSRSELCELTGVSSSTVRRTLGEFQDRIWVRRTGYQFVATPLGEAVATGMEALIERVETEQAMRSVWASLPEIFSDFDVETWAEFHITVAEPDAPYRPIARFDDLIETAASLRIIRPEVAMMEPCFDRICQLVHDGVDVTIVDRPSCHEYFLRTYPERSISLLEYDNFSVLEHVDLPENGIGLVDDRVTVTCFGHESGTVQALLDTEAAAVRAWADARIETHLDAATPLDPTRVSG
ncbi:MAG: helix-turn-helix transcriptional regulator [Halobacteriota archaeon]